MLSYQHVYHAGNRADVLKHAVLCAVLQDLRTRKENVFYVETHAARGLYDLSSKEAQKGAEFPEGIGQVWSLQRTPAPLRPYLDTVKSFNTDGQLTHYPGSPAIATSLLRPSDRFAFFELHPQEITFLEQRFGADDRVQIKKADGYRGALSLAPRGREQMVVLIDPSYETIDDLEALMDWTPRALKRWPNAIVMIWLPLFKDGREDEFGAYLSELAPGGIAGARWPEDPNSNSALAGTAMICYRVSDKVVEQASQIADVCELLWAQAG